MQDDVERAPFQLARRREDEDARLLDRHPLGKSAAEHEQGVGGAEEEKAEACNEMPSPDLALRKDRRKPFGDDRLFAVSGDPKPRQQANEEDGRGALVQQ